MKKILLFTLLVFSFGFVSAGDVVFYSTTTNNVVNARFGISTSRFLDGPGVITFNGNKSLSDWVNLQNLRIAEPNFRRWKHIAGTIVEMKQFEKDQIDAAVSVFRDNQIRISAKLKLDGFISDSLFMRALVVIMLDEINLLRVAHSFPIRTLEQLKLALQNKIDSGDIDNKNKSKK